MGRRNPKADLTRIAVLEYELLYIVPERGTPEADAVDEAVTAGLLERHQLCGKCRRAFRADEEWCPDCTVCPEHGNLCDPPIRGWHDCPRARSILAGRTSTSGLVAPPAPATLAVGERILPIR